MLFNLHLGNNTAKSYLFFFFLIIYLYLVIAKSFKPVSKLVIPIAIPSKEVKAETGIHPVIVEAKIRKCSI